MAGRFDGGSDIAYLSPPGNGPRQSGSCNSIDPDASGFCMDPNLSYERHLDLEMDSDRSQQRSVFYVSNSDAVPYLLDGRVLFESANIRLSDIKIQSAVYRLDQTPDSHGS